MSAVPEVQRQALVNGLASLVGKWQVGGLACAQAATQQAFDEGPQRER